MMKFLTKDSVLPVVILLIGTAVALHAGLRLDMVDGFRHTRYVFRMIGGAGLALLGLYLTGKHLHRTVTRKRAERR